MLKVVLKTPETDVMSIDDIDFVYRPVFLKRNGKFVGMLVKHEDSNQYEFRTSPTTGLFGGYWTPQECIKAVLTYDSTNNPYEVVIDGSVFES